MIKANESAQGAQTAHGRRESKCSTRMNVIAPPPQAFSREDCIIQCEQFKDG